MPDDRSADFAAAAARVGAELKDAEALAEQERWQLSQPTRQERELALQRHERERDEARRREAKEEEDRRRAERELRRAYGGPLGLMRAFQIIAWVGGCLAAFFVTWWAMLLPVSIHIAVEIYVVLCDISAQLRSRDD